MKWRSSSQRLLTCTVHRTRRRLRTLRVRRADEAGLICGRRTLVHVLPGLLVIGDDRVELSQACCERARIDRVSTGPGGVEIDMARKRLEAAHSSGTKHPQSTMRKERLGRGQHCSQCPECKRDVEQ